MNFLNRLMRQPMEEINFEVNYRNLFDADELTEEELLMIVLKWMDCFI